MSLSDQKAQYLERMRRQHDQGTLSKEELDRLMLEAIEQESMKKEADYAWVEACCQLMQDTEQEDALPEDWPDHRKAIWENIQAVMEKEEGEEKVVSLKHISWKKVLAAVACLAVVIGGITLSFSWYEGVQTEEGQTYELRGQTVEVGNGQHATAAGDDTFQDLTTDELSEMTAFLGFTPPLPTWVPDGWELEEYDAYTINGDWEVSVFYLAEGIDTSLSYTCSYAADPSTVIAGFPQDGVGEYVTLAGGKTVYFSTNIEDTIAIWQQQNQYMFIGGPISRDEIIKMIAGIQGEGK